MSKHLTTNDIQAIPVPDPAYPCNWCGTYHPPDKLIWLQHTKVGRWDANGDKEEGWECAYCVQALLKIDPKQESVVKIGPTMAQTLDIQKGNQITISLDTDVP